MMNRAIDAAAIVQWVQVRLGEHQRPSRGISADTELLRDGMLDSLDVIDLVMFVEECTGLDIPVSAIDERHFRTPTSVAAFVATLAEPGPRA